MIDGFLNAIRREVERVLRAQVWPREGNVSQIDPNNPHLVKVTLQPDGAQTDWIPVDFPWIGNGWGFIAMMSVGQQVHVDFPRFGRNRGRVTARIYDQRLQPPANLQTGAAVQPHPQAGEGYLVHQSGALFGLKADGSLAQHSGSLIASGNLANALHKLVHDDFEALYNGHTHAGGPPPDVPMTSAQMTTVLQAN